MPTPEELLDHEMQLAKIAAELTGSQSYATKMPPSDPPPPFFPPFFPFDEYHKRQAQKLAASMDEWTAKISEWTVATKPLSQSELKLNDGPPTIEDENESDDPDYQMYDWAGDWPGYEQTWPEEDEQQNAATPEIELLAAADFEDLSVSELREVHSALRELLLPAEPVAEPEPPRPKRRKFDLDPPT